MTVVIPLDKFDWEEVKPRTVVYLFSAGKDSSLALLLTRDYVRRMCRIMRCRIKLLYVYIPGNTHPANTYCAYTVMEWHKRHYGFDYEVVMANVMFQELVKKYGMMITGHRVCMTKCKVEVISKVLDRLPKPILVIDGMSPNDSKYRHGVVKSEFEILEYKSTKLRIYRWHPLYNRHIPDKISALKDHDEFKCVVKLYEQYGQSMNCVLCPFYWKAQHIGKMLEDEALTYAMREFLEMFCQGSRPRQIANTLRTTPLTKFM